MSEPRDTKPLPPKNADEAVPAPRPNLRQALGCWLQVSVGGTVIGYLGVSRDNYLEVVAQQPDATVFRFQPPIDYILPPYGSLGQRGLGQSDQDTAQFYLPSDWWSQYRLASGGYLQSLYNGQYLSIQTPNDPYNSYLYFYNPYEIVSLTRVPFVYPR